MIFRLVLAISGFCVGRKLVLGTERSLVIGIAGGVIAAGILFTLLIFD
jgi:tetrahydromethanopterin S-methyltransferase subunit F